MHMQREGEDKEREERQVGRYKDKDTETTYREKHRHRQRDRDNNIQRETQTQTERQRPNDGYRQINIDTQKEWYRDRQVTETETAPVKLSMVSCCAFVRLTSKATVFCSSSFCPGESETLSSQWHVKRTM